MSNAVAGYLAVLSWSAGNYERLYEALKLKAVLDFNFLQNKPYSCI